MALSGNSTNTLDSLTDVSQLVASGVTIYARAALGKMTGNAVRPLVSGDVFAGFANEGASAGTTVSVSAQGTTEIQVSGVVSSSVGSVVYASDDATFSLTVGGSAVGVVSKVISPGMAAVSYNGVGDVSQTLDVQPQAPAILDSARYALEKASRGRNTIFYNSGKEEIHVVRLDAYSYADLGSAYTTGMNATGILEAFLVNGVAKDHVWIGKYPAARSASGRVICQPMLDPWVDINWDEAVAACAALGTVSGHTPQLMSTWDWAALTHKIMASGSGQPTGNTDYGRHHTSKWQAGARVDGALPGVTTGTPRTLTGAGPREWNHDQGEFGIADLVGNAWEWQSGYSMSEGVISLAPDNGTSTTEASWVVQSGFTMPASATWSGISNTGASDALKRALIVPATGVTSPAGYLYTTLTGLRFPRRSGSWSLGGSSGLAAMSMASARSERYTNIGFRPAFLP